MMYTLIVVIVDFIIAASLNRPNQSKISLRLQCLENYYMNFLNTFNIECMLMYVWPMTWQTLYTDPMFNPMMPCAHKLLGYENQHFNRQSKYWCHVLTMGLGHEALIGYVIINPRNVYENIQEYLHK